jgi:hypothetical protein
MRYDLNSFFLQKNHRTKSPLKEQLEAQQLELATVKKERNRLEGNHEITKAVTQKPLRLWELGKSKKHGEHDMTY